MIRQQLLRGWPLRPTTSSLASAVIIPIMCATTCSTMMTRTTRSSDFSAALVEARRGIRMTIPNFRMDKFRVKRTVPLSPANYLSAIKNAFAGRSDEDLEKIVFLRPMGDQSSFFLIAERGKVIGYLEPLMTIPPPLPFNAMVPEEVKVVGGLSVRHYIDALEALGAEYRSFLMLCTRDGCLTLTFDIHGKLPTTLVSGEEGEVMQPMFFYSRGKLSTLQDRRYEELHGIERGDINPGSEEGDDELGSLSSSQRSVGPVQPFTRRKEGGGALSEMDEEDGPGKWVVGKRSGRPHAPASTITTLGDTYNIQACLQSTFFDRFFSHTSKHFDNSIAVCPTWWKCSMKNSDNLFNNIRLMRDRSAANIHLSVDGDTLEEIPNDYVGGRNRFYRDTCPMDFTAEERRWIAAPGKHLGHLPNFMRRANTSNDYLIDDKDGMTANPISAEYLADCHSRQAVVNVEGVLKCVSQGGIFLDH